MSKKVLCQTILLACISGCSNDPLPLLSEQTAIKCLGHESTYLYYNGEGNYVFPFDDKEYEKECEGHLIKINAYVKDRNGDNFEMSLADSKAYSTLDKIAFYAEVEGRESFDKGNKVAISGVLTDRSWRGIATVENAILSSVGLLESEMERRRTSISPEKQLELNIVQAEKDRQETDKVLREFARKKRNELINKAVKHSSINQGDLIIDSFELPNNEFVSCRLTMPGPVYHCDKL